MKKVLFVMQSLYNGGAERSLINLLNELPKDDYEISLLLFKKEGMFLSQVPSNVHILDTPEELKCLYAPFDLAGKYRWIKLFGTIISRIVKKKRNYQIAYRWEKFYSKNITSLNQKFDVAIAYISGEVMYYVDEKIEAEKKIVWIHNDYRTAGHPKKNEEKYLERMDAIVSVSERCVEILNEEFPSMKNKTYYIPNLTSSEVVRKRSDEFEPKEFVKDVYNILSIGRLSEQKGFDIAIKSAKCLKKYNVKFKWFVIGTGDLESKLIEQIRNEDVQDCFELLGARENPYPYIKNCSLFVQSSRWEGKSVVLDETKILGIPIVVTDYPTVRDQIIDGKEGVIVEMTPIGIAQGIRDMLDNPCKYDDIKKYLLKNEYGNQDEVRKYINLIEH